MEAISKQAILDKTHYGLNIYSHILRLYYPDEVVMKLIERDCGLCRNPFNANKETLHIWIEKTDPTNALSAEFARHEDSEISCQREQRQTRLAMPSAAEIACHYDTQNAIPAGDAFDFAKLHYKQQDEELSQTLNKELFSQRVQNRTCSSYAERSKQSPERQLNLRIGEERNFYRNNSKNSNQGNQINPINHGSDNLFSFFKAPISNTKPHKAVSLLQIYNVIKGDYYKE